MKSMIGIVVEVMRSVVALEEDEVDPVRELAGLGSSMGSITYNIPLPRGHVENNGLSGLIFFGGEKDDKEKSLILSWTQVVEVRSVENNRPFLRNWFLCSRCRTIAKVGDSHCEMCGHRILVEQNKAICG